jgi:hypothetical protein
MQGLWTMQMDLREPEMFIFSYYMQINRNRCIACCTKAQIIFLTVTIHPCIQHGQSHTDTCVTHIGTYAETYIEAIVAAHHDLMSNW